MGQIPTTADVAKLLRDVRDAARDSDGEEEAATQIAESDLAVIILIARRMPQEEIDRMEEEEEPLWARP